MPSHCFVVRSPEGVKKLDPRPDWCPFNILIFCQAYPSSPRQQSHSFACLITGLVPRGDSHIKGVGMLVVSLRNVKIQRFHVISTDPPFLLLTQEDKRGLYSQGDPSCLFESPFPGLKLQLY